MVYGAMRMKSRVTLMLGLATLLAGPLHGIEANRSYQTIVDRNPFNLKPPPPPAAPPTNEPPAKPPVEIMLTGYSTVTKPKRAYLMSKEPNKKDPYFSLAEGQAKDGVEVLEINERTKTVKIKNAGIEHELTFAKNGITNPPTMMPPGGMPGVVPGQPNPAVMPGQPQAFFNHNNNTTQPVVNNGAPVNNNNAIRSIPSRTLRTQPEPPPTMNMGVGVTPGITTPNVQQQAPAMSVEEQYLLLKANELQGQKAYQRGLAPGPPPPIPTL